MTPATIENIQSRFTTFTHRFSATMTVQDSLTSPEVAAEADGLQKLHEIGQALVESMREMERTLQESLRMGLEQRELRTILALWLPTVERQLANFKTVLANNEGNQRIEAHCRETESFLDRLRALAVHANKPIPPFDSSKLQPGPLPVPAGAAAGFIGVAEARARLRAARKQP
jgi:hypothetical protein